MKQRINELEMRYMRQEATIQELDEIVCRQELAIEMLKKECAKLREQFMTMTSSVLRDPAQEEPPPHY